MQTEGYYLPEKYDRTVIEKYFDSYGMSEWERLVETPRDLVSLHIHTHYLQKYIKRGNQVLEIGPGPGRFTIELAKLGARVNIVDVSATQLKLNEEKVKEAGFEDAIQWRKQMDIIDLSKLKDNSYDACVAYGGPISYVMENADKALSEVLRVTKPRGFIFLGVMSSLGTWQLLVELVFDMVEDLGLEMMQQLFVDGDVIGKLSPEGHHCHMYRWSELSALLQKLPCEIIVASSCGFLSNSVHTEERLRKEMANPETWEAFLRWELEFCREPGAIDGGTHMIVVLRKTT
jgi:ubiquinone/menaquinone biosynthesis C-methylase UbiE